MLASTFVTWVPMLAPKQCSVLESFSRRHFRGSQGAFLKKKVAIRLPLGRQSVCFILQKICFVKVPIFVENRVQESLRGAQGAVWEAFGSTFGSKNSTSNSQNLTKGRT